MNDQVTAPNGGKTFQQLTQERIERGQDINNTWALVTTVFGVSMSVPPNDAFNLTTLEGQEDFLEKCFSELFPVVQRISQKARNH